MPDLPLLLSKAVLALAGCGAGVRLARIARQAGGFPLHAWASAMIFAGGLGLLGFGLGPALAGRSESLARAVMLASDGLERVTLLALAVFVWRVFDSERAWRTLVLAAVWAVLLASWLQTLWAQRWPAGELPRAVDVAIQLSFAAPFLWSTAESGLAYRRARRRERIGLADPLVTNRFLLWTLACGCFAMVCLGTAWKLTLPATTSRHAALGVLTALLYVAIAGIVTLGLSPPAAYRRWLLARGPGPAVPNGSR